MCCSLRHKHLVANAWHLSTGRVSLAQVLSCAAEVLLCCQCHATRRLPVQLCHRAGGFAFSASGALRALRLRQGGASQLLAEGPCDHLWTSHKQLTWPDNALLAKLASQASAVADGAARARVAASNSALIRSHFQALTAAFVAPFARHVDCPIACEACHASCETSSLRRAACMLKQ